MARGFESKDVEFQQAETARPKAPVSARTPEERELAARRRTLELALSRASADLAAASSAVHQRMLEQAIAALREQIGRIE